MGLRGPPNKPTALKVLEGTWRADRVAPDEPEPEIERPERPSHIIGPAREEWDRIVPELERLRLLSQIDRSALAAYCDAYGEWVLARRELQKGRVCKTPQGMLMPHPAVAIRNKALEHMKAFLTEFGMTPGSRTRMRATPPQAKPVTMKDRLRGGSGGNARTG